MPQLCERLAVKGNYVINIPPWQKTKTGQKLHQNLILMKSAPRRFGKNTRGGVGGWGGGMKHLFAKWAVTFGQMENMYTIMIIPPPPFILLQKNEFGAHSVVYNNL